jgi:RNA polymerase sigma factor (sigma-70 family)
MMLAVVSSVWSVAVESSRVRRQTSARSRSKNEPMPSAARISIPRPNAEEERALIKRAQAGDKQATDQIVRATYALVVSVAKKYCRASGAGVDEVEDRVADGCIGVLRAIEKFELRSNVRFSTYAMCWIKGSIRRELWLDSTVHVPSGRQRTWNNGSYSLRTRAVARSLDAPLGRDNQTDNVITYLDVLRDTSPSPESSIIEKDDAARSKARIRQALNRLNEKERFVIEMRHLAADGEKRTLAQVAEPMSVSWQHVQQIETKALAKLMRALKNDGHSDGSERRSRSMSASKAATNEAKVAQVTAPVPGVIDLVAHLSEQAAQWAHAMRALGATSVKTTTTAASPAPCPP